MNPLISKRVSRAEADRTVAMFARLRPSLGAHMAVRLTEEKDADGGELVDVCMWNDGARDIPAWALEMEKAK